MTAQKVHSTYCQEFREVFDPKIGKRTLKAWKDLQTAMYNQHKNLMFKVARRYVTLEYTEALTVCKLGFCQGMNVYANNKMYEKAGGIHLCAHLELYMRSACQKAYRDDKNISIPHNQQYALEKAKKSKLFDKDECELTPDEIELKNDLERFVLPVMNQPSLDTKVSDDDDATIGDITTDYNAVNALNQVINDQRINLLKEAIDKLPYRQQMSLIHCKGLFGEDEKTYRDVGLMIGVSHEMVSNYLKTALAFVDEFIIDNVLIENHSFD